MQTRNLGLRGIALALAGVLTVGLAACDDTDTVTPAQPIVVTVSPTGTVELNPGETFRVSASVQNATQNQGVTFSSSNTAVATVDGTGNVTAVAPGIASIIAASAQDPTKTAAVTVRVIGDDVPPTEESISIISVVDNDAEPVDADSVTGQINVRVDYERGAATRLQVLVNNIVACEQTFDASAAIAAEGIDAAAAALEYVCPINTLRVDPATGEPTYENGPIVITARLLGADNAVLASASTQTLTLNNADAINLTVSAERQAIGGGGLQWFDGAVTVTATPAIFTEGTSIARVTVQAVSVEDGEDEVIATRSDTDASNGLSVTFPETTAGGATNTLAGVSVDSLVFVISAVTAAGQEFQFSSADANRSRAIRYDNVAPTAGDFTVEDDFFAGADFRFNAGAAGGSTTELYEGAADPMPGSNALTYTFAYIDEGDVPAGTDTQAELAAVFGDATEVATGDDIPETTTNDAYALLVRIRDAVGNTTYEMADAFFGSDPNAPTDVEIDGIDNNDVNPEGEVEVTFEEDISGPADEAILIRATRIDAEGEECYDFAEDEDTDALSSGTCPWIADDVFNIPTTDGYYDIEVAVQDAAGNISETEELFFLVDNTAPEAEIGSVTTSTTQVTLTGEVTDNVDLAEYNTYLGFTDGTFLSFDDPIEVSDFGLPADGEADASATVPLIRGLQSSVGGVPSPVNSATLAAFDVAGNFALADDAAAVVSQTESDGIDGEIAAFELTSSEDAICIDAGSDECEDGDVENTATLRAVATGPAGTFTTPFTAVYFYREIAEGVWRLIDIDTSGSISTGTENRTYTYTATLNGADLDGDTNIVAVGVDSERDALHTAPITVEAVPGEEEEAV